MRVIRYPQSSSWPELIRRPESGAFQEPDAVLNILNTVKIEGDKALLAYTARFDRVELPGILVPNSVLRQAWEDAPEDFRSAVRTAVANIRTFHRSQRENERRIETMPGVSCWRRSVPIERVGIYVPGGSAPLFSSLFMSAVPALEAGCGELIVCSPPGENGLPSWQILAVAGYLDLPEMYAVGGAQAIAAMAWGTETVPSVDKIFGPGNSWVTAAKQMVQQMGVAIDLPAGPSEVLVIADSTADPAFVAADLLSQAEHGADSQVVMVTTDASLLEKTMASVQDFLEKLPRKNAAEIALQGSLAIMVRDLDEALAFSNAYAPEHLILQVADAGKWAEQVINAGSVFVGPWSCESLGDYASGTNHTLPTNGFARMYSGVSLDSFLKKITFQEVSKRGLEGLGPVVSTLATYEQLDAHRLAVDIRLQSPDGGTKDADNDIIAALIPGHLRDIKTYSSARDEFQGKADIFLDANELPFHEKGYNRYPDPKQTELRERYARWRGLSPENVAISNGSDEAIEWLTRGFCRPGFDSICITTPTYGMYEVVASWFDLPVIRVPLLNDFQPDVPALLKAQQGSSCRILFLCSPNNPTGNAVGPEQIDLLLQEWQGLLVIDEAYIDFSQMESVAQRISKHPRLLVIQTFSKSFGLAGLRVGALLADERIIAHVDRIKAPYNVDHQAAQQALQALERVNEFEDQWEQIRKERERLAITLEDMPIVTKVWPGEGNFLLVQFQDSGQVMDMLRRSGIIVRDRSRQVENAIRITIGTPEENNALIEILERECLKT